MAAIEREGTLTRHGEVLRVKVPLPFPLRYVNCYLVPGTGGWTLIDPGLHTQAAVQLWEETLSALSLSFADIGQIVLTHHHPDHYGLAGWFQARCGAPVRLSAEGLRQVRLLWGEGQPLTDGLLALFRAHGLPADLEAPMRVHMDGFVQAVSPQPEVTTIAAGDVIRLGDEPYEAIASPGHAAGHLCFYQAETKTMFCGDHVLPQISPNVSYLPGGIDDNPLASYLAALAAIARYDVALAFPGHREPFAHLSQRALELIRHHEQRLDAMRALLREPKTAYDVCRSLFGEKLTLHQLRFALAETLAHLIWLREAGQGEELPPGADGVRRFRQA